jgi:transposase
MYTSLLDSFFLPTTRIVVVSEERLQQAEREAKLARLKAVDDKLDELREYRQTLAKELAPAKEEATDNG